MILIGLFCAVSVTAMAIALGGPDKLIVFWDTPSVMVVVMTNFVLIMSSGKWDLFLRGMVETGVMGPTKPEPRAEEIASFFRFLSNGNIIGGIFWAIIGCVLMLADLDPDKIGSGLAVTLLTNFYAMFLSIFLYLPLRERFVQSTKINEKTDSFTV